MWHGEAEGALGNDGGRGSILPCKGNSIKAAPVGSATSGLEATLPCGHLAAPVGK